MAGEFSDHPVPDIEINYASGRTAPVPGVDRLKQLLITEQRSVVVFGEGNFTFTVALAALRQSYRGIISTTLMDPERQLQFSDIKLLTIESCVANGKRFEDSHSAVLGRVEALLRLPSPPDSLPTVQFNIDATNTPDSLGVQGKIVWFQCPWIGLQDQETNTATLVREFLTHMETKQSPGDYLLIGIANFFPYVIAYRLGELLGDNLSQGAVGQYSFLGADTALVQEILRYGYRHQGITNIHDKIFESHVTLVFQKQNNASVS